MERIIPLDEMGEKIRNIRKSAKLNQINFYRTLYPEKDLEEENIKKKMNTIENGKMKKVNFDLLFRIHEKFDVSLDFLFGYETVFPNYENKAVCEYTGLSADAVNQLHFWSRYKGMNYPEYDESMDERQFHEYCREKDRINEAKWILYIASKLLEKKSDDDEKTGIADLSILYDIYMLTLDPPETISGIPNEVATSNLPFWDKFMSSVRIASDSISFSDSMGEAHTIDIGKINHQIWKERLLADIETFVRSIKEKPE